MLRISTLWALLMSPAATIKVAGGRPRKERKPPVSSVSARKAAGLGPRKPAGLGPRKAAGLGPRKAAGLGPKGSGSAGREGLRLCRT